MKRMIFNEVVEWVESRLAINPSVDDIACGVGYSRRFVYNLFREHAGLPVGKYIRMRRMTLAAGKLKLTQQSISSIACLLHFDSHQTFSREFKKTFGLCPREYRDSPCWDMSLLHQKVALQGGSLSLPYLCFLEEQSFVGYGFNYTLSLTDDIATRKEATRRKIVGGTTSADRDIYILSECSPAARNIYKTAINGFIGTPFNSRTAAFREVRVAKRGLYLGLEFSGSWDDFILLSNRVYLQYLPELGLYRRKGYDIERFIPHKNVGSGSERTIYTLHYFVPVGYI